MWLSSELGLTSEAGKSTPACGVCTGKAGVVTSPFCSTARKNKPRAEPEGLQRQVRCLEPRDHNGNTKGWDLCLQPWGWDGVWAGGAVPLLWVFGCPSSRTPGAWQLRAMRIITQGIQARCKQYQDDNEYPSVCSSLAAG